MRAPAPRRRGWSAAAIVLLLLAQVLALGHTATVQHVRCAAHGELVEGANVDVHAGDGVRFVGARAGTGGDDHCELAAALHHAATTARPSIAFLATSPSALVAVPPVETVLPTTIYLFAPKTSPPDLWVSLT